MYALFISKSTHMLHKLFLSSALCMFILTTMAQNDKTTLLFTNISSRLSALQVNTSAMAPKPDAIIDANNTGAIAFSIYPNPVKQSMHIQFSSPIQTTGVLSLYDIMGRIIYRYALTNGQQQHIIDTHDYPTGIYICILSEGANTYTQKIAVSH